MAHLDNGRVHASTTGLVAPDALDNKTRCTWIRGTPTPPHAPASTSPESRELAQSGGPLRDRQIGREMSCARTEVLGGPTAPPISSMERPYPGASSFPAGLLDPPRTGRSSRAR